MKRTTAILSAAVILGLALTSLVSACASRSENARSTTLNRQADVRESTESPMSSTTGRSTRDDIAVASAVKERLVNERIARRDELRVNSDHGTVYLKGSVDTPEGRRRAAETAAEVAGVTTVVNQLHVGSEGAMEPGRTSRWSGDAGQCSLVMRNPALRNEAVFGPIQVRVFTDVASPRYHGMTTRTYDGRSEQPLTGAEIRALERQKGRPLTDAEIRGLDQERALTSREGDVRPSREMSARTLTRAEIRAVEEQKGRPLTEAEIRDLEQQRGRPLTEAEPRSLGEISGRTLAEAQGGETGGKQQETGSAQQAGASEEMGRSRATSGEHQLALTEHDRMTTEQRRRLYGDEARIADRRGNLVWSGWLKPNEKVEISNADGPIRYDYRFIVDDRFHGEQGASCNNNVINVP